MNSARGDWSGIIPPQKPEGKRVGSRFSVEIPRPPLVLGPSISSAEGKGRESGVPISAKSCVLTDPCKW